MPRHGTGFIYNGMDKVVRIFKDEDKTWDIPA
jgi:hypothetical protein